MPAATIACYCYNCLLLLPAATVACCLLPAACCYSCVLLLSGLATFVGAALSQSFNFAGLSYADWTAGSAFRQAEWEVSVLLLLYKCCADAASLSSDIVDHFVCLGRSGPICSQTV